MPTVYNNLGVLYFDLKAYQKAELLFIKVLEMDEALGQVTQTSTDFHNLGLLYHDQSQCKKALPYFEKAIQLKEDLRQQGASQQRLSYQDQEFNTYELLVDTLIELKKEERALQVWEQYKNRELLRKMQAGVGKQSMTFNVVQTLLPPNACLIILGNSRNNSLVDFAINKNQTKALTIPLNPFFDKPYPEDKKSQTYIEQANWFNIKESAVQKHLEQERYQKTRRRSNDAHKLEALIHYYRYRLNRDPRLWNSRKVQTDRKIGRFFYKLLLAPFYKFLENAQQLIIIANDLLELIPFDTIRTPDDSYLIENLAIQYVPSINVLRHLSQKSASGKLQKILALGIGDYSFSKKI